MKLKVKYIIKKLLLLFLYLIFPIITSTAYFFFNKSYFTNIEKNFRNNIFKIYSRDNNLINEYSELVFYNELPKNFINALIASEDINFFTHFGFSLKSIIRSFFYNIKKKSFVQGGSTITQQYIKLYTGNSKKTIFRKIKELILSVFLEICCTKEEILENYCNLLYFGKNIFGLSECTKIFFNKSYKDLTLNESALLAGIIQRPEYYNPIKNKDLSIKKKNIILKKMYLEGFINKEKYEIAIKTDINIENNNTTHNNKNILNSIKSFFLKKNFPLNHEYIIHTTIDENIQNIAQTEFNQHISKLKQECNSIEGSLILFNYNTGEIVSIINGYSKQSSDQAFTSHNQIGSIIKPLVAYHAFENNETAETIYPDLPLEKAFNYNPENHYKKYLGKMSIEDSLTKSNNIIPVRILHRHGINNFINLIQPFFKKEIFPYWSLALGCIEATLIEVAQLYNSFFGSQKNKKLHFVKKIIKKSGGLIYESTQNHEKKLLAFNKKNVRKTKKILRKIGKMFTNKYKKKITEPVYIKTGTTNGAVNCWSVCANKKYCIIALLRTEKNIKLVNYNITSSKSLVPLILNILEKIK